MKQFVVTCLVVWFAVATMHAQFRPPQRVVTDTIYSEVLQAKRAYTVILPQSFEWNKEKQYPVLYLLHGMYGKNDDWAIQGRVLDVYDQLVLSGESCEMVIVTPDAGGGNPEEFQNGYFNVPDWEYERFFFDELMPYVEKRFRVKGDRQHRAIAGLSMGGGGCTSYAQRHTDLFCAAYAMSALMDLPQKGDAKTDNPDGKLAKLNRSVIENSCVEYVKTADKSRQEALRTVKWFVDCGDDDFLLDCNTECYRAMRNAHIPCQLRVRDGSHNWEYWHTALYQCLPFASRAFMSF